jgi:hypothetical protein
MREPSAHERDCNGVERARPRVTALRPHAREQFSIAARSSIEEPLRAETLDLPTARFERWGVRKLGRREACLENRSLVLVEQAHVLVDGLGEGLARKGMASGNVRLQSGKGK